MEKLSITNEYRAKPFWSLNGKLDKNELKRQIHIMKEMGFGGAFIHSRTGLETQYLGDEWFDAVNFCCDEMSKLGLEAYLYDEDRWPSGSCGGLVARNPKFRTKYISMHRLSKNEFDIKNYSQEFIAAFAVKFNNEAVEDFYRIYDNYGIEKSYEVLVFVVEEMGKSDFYNGFTYIDTLNADATNEFIKLTHERYKEILGDKFGKQITGIFVDEPHRGALLNGFGLNNENKNNMLPYTYKLFSVFEKRWGYNLEDYLPILFFKYKGENFSKTMWNYVEVIMQMFIDNFAKPYQKWCKENKLVVTGHVLHEDSLSAQTTMCGSVMRYYEYMDYPGMDNLGETNSPYFVAQQVNSVAKQLNKKFKLTELYGCTGWKSTFLHYKQIGDWQANFGMNLRCPHLSWYTMKGEAKRDYPASILHQASWYKEYKYIEDYFARIGFLLSNSKDLTDTLVISPIESAWGLSHINTYKNFFGVNDKEYENLEKDYFELNKLLNFNQIDFDYADEEIMSRKFNIYDNLIGTENIKYKKVVLSGLINIRKSTVEILNKFIKSGGQVIFKNLPLYIEGERSDINKYLSGFKIVDDDKLIKILKSDKEFSYDIENKNQFISIAKKYKNNYILFTVNQSRSSKVKTRITIDGIYNIEKINLRNGENQPIDFCHMENKTIIDYGFDISEELMLTLSKDNVLKSELKPLFKHIKTADSFDYKLNEDNRLVLDFPKYYVNGNYEGQDEILKVDRKLRDKFDLNYRGGEMVQPWFKEKYLNESTNKKQCDLKLDYSFNAEYIPEKLSMFIENAELFEISLNNNKISLNEIKKTDIDTCFDVIDIDKNFILKGKNILSVKCGYKDKINLESIHLSGNFGVRLENSNDDLEICTIIKLPKKLYFGDITTQGLPFYSDKIQYFIPLEKGKYTFELDNLSNLACVIFKSETKTELIAFPPYLTSTFEVEDKITITAVFTRKNWFGPLHELPALTEVCGPDSFLSQGENFTKSYSLISQGLPELKINKIL